ncbi:CRISPR associated protein [Caballeronia catudaia]|uniref:CRISPR associated protein n=1 Tax=Caballeronia catudaia TaxID=1777136 RepID=A0A158C5J6_9BURK|nr:type I-E CRISPR-associated protein Cas6/Cse3/CasE [Caballeronia catudaia]SAK77550.1 CRISPR associated protein [Caballeronia catudaia]
MTTLNLIHCQPDLRKLVPWAARQGWLPPGGDVGYALHAALGSAFGERAPKPFYYRDEHSGLLGYCPSSADELREAASLASPDIAALLGLDAVRGSSGLSIREFPTQWTEGRVLGFEVRVCPVIRDKEGHQHDVYGAARDRAEVKESVQREPVYKQWLARQFIATGAAEIIESRMTRFQVTTSVRRTKAASGSDGKRAARRVGGPDAVFCGHLRIEDTEAFAGLLARGVGRHRAFGFGMLRLKPASISA